MFRLENMPEVALYGKSSDKFSLDSIITSFSLYVIVLECCCALAEFDLPRSFCMEGSMISTQVMSSLSL